MNIQKLREAISENMVLDANDDFRQEKCWKVMIDVLSESIQETLSFFRNDCTDEELFWLGAVFEDVAEKNQSEEFIQVLWERLAKVLPEKYLQHSFKSEHMQKWVDYTEYVRALKSDIEFAEARIAESEKQ